MKLTLVLLTIAVTTGLFVASCSSPELTKEQRDQREQDARDRRDIIRKDRG